ncbi:BgtTE-56031 [Blumeria graminis f. sp. tritici]|uniref:BgtTE-56031 n=1 Tax=Blumeria graminis f. sp. tritici TaxID=62690 RepID=A0A9X9PSK8_BLUGR|nr:BgtTE-56031 [Blumeria graminis f. sp. tritici]
MCVLTQLFIHLLGYLEYSFLSDTSLCYVSLIPVHSLDASC